MYGLITIDVDKYHALLDSINHEIMQKMKLQVKTPHSDKIKEELADLRGQRALLNSILSQCPKWRDEHGEYLQGEKAWEMDWSE